MADIFNLRDHVPGSHTWGREATKYCDKCIRKTATYTTGNSQVFNNKLCNT